MPIPLATYRLQFNSKFTFDDASLIADYLALLGVSHIYASPYLQAVSGSAHGYDVVNPSKVNEELGGMEGHKRFCRTLGEHNLGQVLDIVPNHMATTGQENIWWWDVLENGPYSRYAGYFDIHWEGIEGSENKGNQIIIPILGNHYGKELEDGKLALRRDEGKFFISYYDHTFPVTLPSLSDVFMRAGSRVGSSDLIFIGDILKILPNPQIGDYESIVHYHKNKEVLQSQLLHFAKEQEEIIRAINLELEEINIKPQSLDSILERQNYRLVFWRTAETNFSYRRFFDINTLVGLRMEEERVFMDTHRLILEWLSEKVLDGVRIDHPDGLRDPEKYLLRLKNPNPEVCIIVEKILSPGESLPAGWPVEGTTGYDFMNLAGGLFIDKNGEKPLTDFYFEFSGISTDYKTLVREKKMQIIRDMLGSDITYLSWYLLRTCEQDYRYRDFMRQEINEVLSEYIACLPVYRTYVRPLYNEISPEDKRIITETIKEAKERRPDLSGDLFDFLNNILTLSYRNELCDELVMRHQQVTGSVMAKGVEDTAFYCYNRFISLNEVGGEPTRFGISIDYFHKMVEAHFLNKPHTMLTTSTHDNKRSEDFRARLNLISEIPDKWIEAVRRWSAHNEIYRKNEIPDRNMEYFIYQTLTGVWPIEQERILAYMEKAIKEAKVFTSWTRQNKEYEDGVLSFIKKILADKEFMSDFEEFLGPLFKPGWINSLSQILIKFTIPGIPDIYQGSELWDFSLVDPDNRRPVDFKLRRKILAELDTLEIEEIMDRIGEGLPKIWVIRQSLRLRQKRPELFDSTAGYYPIIAEGQKESNVISFRRGEDLVVIAPRFIMSLGDDWGNTKINISSGQWRNEFTKEEISGGENLLKNIFKKFPVALLVKV